MKAKKVYQKPTMIKMEYSFKAVWKKKCDFACQTDGCVASELQYK